MLSHSEKRSEIKGPRHYESKLQEEQCIYSVKLPPWRILTSQKGKAETRSGQQHLLSMNKGVTTKY